MYEPYPVEEITEIGEIGVMASDVRNEPEVISFKPEYALSHSKS